MVNSMHFSYRTAEYENVTGHDQEVQLELFPAGVLSVVDIAMQLTEVEDLHVASDQTTRIEIKSEMVVARP